MAASSITMKTATLRQIHRDLIRIRFLAPLLVRAFGRHRRFGREGQTVSQRLSGPRGAPSRRGVTLLELIVVLALLGLVLAIAAPAFIVPSPPRESDLGAAVATARRAAILRAEPVTLAIDAAGAWRVDGDASPSAPSIATGTLAQPIGNVRIRISAVGTCIPEPTDDARLADWNALGCGFATTAEVRRP
jgi:prepilin-type N-terminal cleavage/methylation domain-containing protein